MTFLTGGILPIRTRCESGGDGLAPPLVPEGHQVDGVLFPWPQTSLHKGSDSAGQLGGHPSVIVLQAARHKAMRENTLERRPCCYCIFSMNITLLLGFDVSEWKWEKKWTGQSVRKNPPKNPAIICAVISAHFSDCAGGLAHYNPRTELFCGNVLPCSCDMSWATFCSSGSMLYISKGLSLIHMESPLLPAVLAEFLLHMRCLATDGHQSLLQDLKTPTLAQVLKQQR